MDSWAVSNHVTIGHPMADSTFDWMSTAGDHIRFYQCHVAYCIGVQITSFKKIDSAYFIQFRWDISPNFDFFIFF